MFSIKGKELLVRSLNLPSVDAIYFTESEEELRDLIFIHRWCMVFPLSSSTLVNRLTYIGKVVENIENGKQNPYVSSTGFLQLQSGASILARNRAQVGTCVRGVLAANPDSIKVLIPLRVYRNKVQGLFDWFYEDLQASYAWRQPATYTIEAKNTLTNRPLTDRSIYRLEYTPEQEESLRKKSSGIVDPRENLWVLGTKVDRAAAIESSSTVKSSGDWLIDGDKVDIYNNDMYGEIRSMNPCSQCPNALKRIVGNCYFMTSQCKDLTLPNSEDKTSWKTLKSKK
jgi:hypothetical protein